MKKNLLLLIVISSWLSSMDLRSQSWNLLAKGLASKDVYDGYWHNQGFTVDAAGNIYLAAFVNDTITLNSTPIVKDPNTVNFIGKLNTSGHLIWHRSLGGISIASMVADHNSDIIISGCLNCTSPYGSVFDQYIIKYDSAGGVRWTQKILGSEHSYRQVEDVMVDDEDNIYIRGKGSDTMRFGQFELSGQQVRFIAKCDKNGNFLWAHGYANNIGGAHNSAIYGGKMFILEKDSLFTFDLSGHKIGEAFVTKANIQSLYVTIDGSGSIYATGVFYDTAVFGSTTFSEVAPCGKFYGGCGDIFLYKMDQNGVIQWARTLYSYSTDQVIGVAVSSDGNIRIAGNDPSKLYASGQVLDINNGLFGAVYSPNGQLISLTGVDRGAGMNSAMTCHANEVFISVPYYSAKWSPPLCVYFENDSLCNFNGYYIAGLRTGDNSSIREHDALSVMLAPNPTEHTIKLIGAVHGSLIRVRNSLGQLVIESAAKEIDLSGHPKGLYFVEVTYGINRIMQKVIFQ